MNHNQPFRADKVREMRAKYVGWHSPVPLVVGFAIMHGNATREVVRAEVSQSRTPPQTNPHDPNESVLDIALPEPLARVGCPGYEDDYMPTCKGSVLFWPVMLAVAYVAAWGLLMWGGR